MSIKDGVITGILMVVSACLGMVYAQSSPEILAQPMYHILPLASFGIAVAFTILFIQDVSKREALEFRSYWGGLGGGVGGFTVSPGVVYALLTLVFSGMTLFQIMPQTSKTAEPPSLSAGSALSTAIPTPQPMVLPSSVMPSVMPSAMPSTMPSAQPSPLPAPTDPPTPPTTLHIELPGEELSAPGSVQK